MDEQTETQVDAAKLLPRLKAWFRKDKNFSSDWRNEAKEDFDFVAGEQWTEAEQSAMKRQLKPVITFNRIGPVVNAVSGQETANRQETRFIPREPGDVKANELLTSAALWFRDDCDADHEESDGFLDATTCGMGWTETRISVDENPQGDPDISRIDPLEMYWDASARKRNLVDGRRVTRVRKLSLSDAREEFPGFDDDELNGNWVNGEDGSDVENPFDDYDGENGSVTVDGSVGFMEDDKEITILHMEWYEREQYIKYLDPYTGQISERGVDGFDTFKERMEALKGPLQHTKPLKRKVYKRAFIGKVILNEDDLDSPYQKGFSFSCITGYRDQNKGTWYGIVRAMKDPQRWGNKWMSQLLHIMNSQAKGGLMMEKSAADNQKQFEKSWANPEAITWLSDGALSGPEGGKVQPKPAAQFPAGFYQIMEFALSSIRDVTGVNLELMGMREANQAGVLEYQRREAGLTILSTFFDSLKRYRKIQGRCMLYMINNYLSDGRLIKIVGEGEAQYVPLMRQADVEHDIIVDDMPTAPNQKERVWGIVGPIFMQLPPNMQKALLEYSPLPETVIGELKKAMDEAPPPEQQQAQQQAQQLGMAEMMAQIEKLRSEAAENKAQAEHIDVKKQADALDAGLKVAQAAVPPGVPVQ